MLLESNLKIGGQNFAMSARLLNLHYTMVILHKEGRKKFGFSSKPTYGVIVVNTKIYSSVKMVLKYVKKLRHWTFLE